jgi:hypothetical protein
MSAAAQSCRPAGGAASDRSTRKLDTGRRRLATGRGDSQAYAVASSAMPTSPAKLTASAATELALQITCLFLEDARRHFGLADTTNDSARALGNSSPCWDMWLYKVA